LIPAGVAAETDGCIAAPLTHSKDSSLRFSAHEAFFFARPEKQDCLPIALSVLQSNDKDIQTTAAQWLVERFPDEVEKAGMKK